MRVRPASGARPAGRPIVLILGGTSGVGRAVGQALARRGRDLIVTGRDPEEAARTAQDLEIRYGVSARSGTFDALDASSHAAFAEGVLSEAGDRLEGVVVAFGALGDPEEAAADPREAVRIATVNYTGAVSVLTPLARHLQQRGRGFVLGISSVAGDRGRGSNHVYGSAKGGLSLFLQGLRNRLHPHGVRVVTAKLGFVDTQMTWGLPGLFLVADPAEAGEGLVRAVKRRKEVIYYPWFWRPVMAAIRLIPERLFKRLRF